MDKKKFEAAIIDIKQKQGECKAILADIKQKRDDMINIAERASLREDRILQLINYHQEHIEPCRKILESITKAIYNWSDALTTVDVDCTKLFEYLGKSLIMLDDYIEKERISQVP